MLGSPFCIGVLCLAQAMFHHGDALGWRGFCLQSVVSLVSLISFTRLSAAASSWSLVGRGGSGGGFSHLQNIVIHSSLFLGSKTKPCGVMSVGSALSPCA